MLKNSDSGRNKTKVMKISIAMIVIILLLLAISLGYYLKQQANVRREEQELNYVEQRGKEVITSYISHNKIEYEKFLKDENLPIVLLRFKEHMDTYYPSIGYGTKYKEITVERLTNEYMEVSEELNFIAKDLEKEDTELSDVIFEVNRTIRMDGIWVQRGTTKGKYDSAEEVMRKSKAWCMDYLYIDGYAAVYTIYGYEEIHFEAFLADERLPIFLVDMKEYMNTHYPEVGYGSQYEEITVERLKNDYETVYLELEEMIGKVEETGASWNSIIWKIRNEAGMSENRYDSKE